jgi:hypothetical protein
MKHEPELARQRYEALLGQEQLMGGKSPFVALTDTGIVTEMRIESVDAWRNDDGSIEFTETWVSTYRAASPSSSPEGS